MIECGWEERGNERAGGRFHADAHAVLWSRGGGRLSHSVLRVGTACIKLLGHWRDHERGRAGRVPSTSSWYSRAFFCKLLPCIVREDSFANRSTAAFHSPAEHVAQSCGVICLSTPHAPATVTPPLASRLFHHVSNMPNSTSSRAAP